MPIPLSEIKRYWGAWMLWRATEKPSFMEALGLPSRMLSVFFTLDMIAGKMEKQKAARERARNAQQQP